MKRKLILRLDNALIEEAKKYARVRNTSLSNLIEAYLTDLIKSNDVEVTPLVKSLSGVIALPKNFDHQKEYERHLRQKYFK